MRIEHNSRNLFYRTPFGAVTSEQSVRIRLGIEGGGIPNAVRLVYIDKDKNENELNMSYITEIGGFCMYEAVIPKQNKCGNVWYYFDVTVNHEHFYYANNDKMLGGTGKIYREKPKNPYQITVYSPKYKTPEWWNNAVCYQIFCDRFFNGNENGEFLGERNDIIKRKWNDIPFYTPNQFGGEYLANDFFGGNFLGIEKKLEYLAQLGIDAIYLNPVFKAYSNHKYDTGDYMRTDEMFGTEDDFKRLCRKAEEYGIRIILDGVFNHTGSDSRYFNRKGTYDSEGAYQSRQSPYFEWYTFKHWNDDYESWWGMKTLPQVNENSKSYREYILTGENSVVKHWLKDGAYGWRLDVVDELPGDFVKTLRKEVKKQNPEAVIIGEVWEDASNKISYGEEREYFLGEELDSVMNYPLRDAVIAACTEKINAEEFDERLMSIKENYPKPAFYSLLNMLSSHDTERILTAMTEAPDRRTVSKEWQAEYKADERLLRLAEKRVKQAVMLQMLLPGVPCVYYGDEAGLFGYGDPFCRGTYPWGNENGDLLAWYKKAVALRKSSKAFVFGELETVYKVENTYGFIRFSENEKRIVITNFGSDSVWVRLDLARYNIDYIKNELYEEYYRSDDGIYYIELLPHGIKVFGN